MPVQYYGGLPLSADHVLDGVLPHLGELGEAGEGEERAGGAAAKAAVDAGAARPKVGAS